MLTYTGFMVQQLAHLTALPREKKLPSKTWNVLGVDIPFSCGFKVFLNSNYVKNSELRWVLKSRRIYFLGLFLSPFQIQH